MKLVDPWFYIKTAIEYMDLYLDNECRCGQINQSTKSEGILVKILKFPVETY